MKKLQRTLLSVAAGLCFAGGSNAAIVDLFDDPPAPSFQAVEDNTANGTPVYSEYPAAPPASNSILGGYRDLIVNKVSGSSFGASRLNVSDGALNFSNDTGGTPVVGTAKVQWDGLDAGADKSINVQGLNENLVTQLGCPAGGCDRFQAQVLFSDQGFNYDIILYSGAANWTKLTALSQFPIDSSNTEIADYFFAWFALAETTGNLATLQGAPIDGSGNCTSVGNNGGAYYCLDGLAFLIDQNGTGADVTNITSVEFVLNDLTGTAAVDLTLGSITKTGVPEPGTLALVGLSLLGLGAVRRRRMI